MKGKGETSRDDDGGDNIDRSIDRSPTTERPTLHSPVAGILLVDKKVLGVLGSQLARMIWEYLKHSIVKIQLLRDFS